MIGESGIEAVVTQLVVGLTIAGALSTTVGYLARAFSPHYRGRRRRRRFLPKFFPRRRTRMTLPVQLQYLGIGLLVAGVFLLILLILFSFISYMGTPTG